MQDKRPLFTPTPWQLQTVLTLACALLLHRLAHDQQRAVAGREQRQQQVLLAGNVVLLWWAGKEWAFACESMARQQGMARMPGWQGLRGRQEGHT